jgi:hypothetical protein
MKITWDELAIDLTGQSSNDLLSEWRWMVSTDWQLRMVSALGDAFLESPDGGIHWLDVATAELTRIADSRARFDELRQLMENAECWFMPQLVGDLIVDQGPLQAGQCFSYKIPPSLGGGFEPDNFEACSLLVHFGVLGQIQAQVKPLPPGTKITEVRSE